MLYAVIRAGGKQYKVKENDQIEIEHIEGKSGKNLNLKDIVLLNDNGKTIADPDKLKKASVKASLVEHFKGEKVVIFKHKPRKNYRRKRGHRQQLTLVKIEEITLDGQKLIDKETKKEVAKKKQVTKKKPAKKVAQKTKTKEDVKKKRVAKKKETVEKKEKSKEVKTKATEKETKKVDKKSTEKAKPKTAKKEKKEEVTKEKQAKVKNSTEKADKIEKKKSTDQKKKKN